MANPTDNAAPPATEYVDAAFGKYVLLAHLGQGGQADVLLALAQGALGFNKLVVVKRLRPDLARNPEFVRMFVDEARLAARLNHPNVVQTHEVGEVDQIYFLAMEYLDGQPLRRLVDVAGAAPERISQALWVRIVADALDGLHYAHELADFDGSPLNIVHRDISPHNILVTYDGQVKVLDFGIAKAAMNSASTKAGTLKGKISYMAPEQAVGLPVDRRADVFAVGIILWELLTGKRLFQGEPAQVLMKVKNVEVPRPSTLVPDLDPRLDAIVMRALGGRAGERFETALAMRTELEEFLRATGQHPDRHDVASAMKEMFALTREHMQKQIQDRLAAVGVSAAKTLPALGGFVTAASADDAAPPTHKPRGGSVGVEGQVALDAGLRAKSSPSVPPPAATPPDDGDVDALATRREGAEAHESRDEPGGYVPTLTVAMLPLPARIAMAAGTPLAAAAGVAGPEAETAAGPPSDLLAIAERPRVLRRLPGPVMGALAVGAVVLAVVVLVASYQASPRQAAAGEAGSRGLVTLPMAEAPVPSVSALGADDAAPATTAGAAPPRARPVARPRPERRPSNCSPPYTVDDHDVRHFKPECL